MIKNEVDTITILANDWKIFNSKFDGKYTKTAQFILPAIELPLSPIMLRAFKNSFLDDSEHEHNYIRPVFNLFLIEDLKAWNKTHLEIIKHPNYVNDYNSGVDKDGNDYVMYVFSVPDKFAEDYLNFKRGRYSKFSIDYKKKFPQYVSTKTKQESEVWMIINKSEDIKKRIADEFDIDKEILDKADEIWEIPLKEREIYNYKTIK